MKYQGISLMAVIVSCLAATLLSTAETLVTNDGSDGNGSSILLQMLFLFPLLCSKTEKAVVGVETDHDFYNRVVCLRGTSAPDTKCLTCFDHVDQTTCAADPNCTWNTKNYICIPK